MGELTTLSYCFKASEMQFMNFEHQNACQLQRILGILNEFIKGGNVLPMVYVLIFIYNNLN